MFDVGRLGTALLRVVPTLKTLTQLSGFTLGVVVFLIGYVSSPPNLPVLIAAGLIGASVLVFTLSMNVLEAIPKGQRAKFILVAFFGFLVTVTIFFSVAVYFYLKGPELKQKAEADILADALRQKYGELQPKSDVLIIENRALEREIAAASGTFAQLLALEAKANGVRSTLDDTTRQMELVTELLTDSANPASRLAAIIERAKSNLGIQPRESLGLITRAHAAPTTSSVVEHDLGARILQGVSADDDSYISKCLDAAWVYQIRGQLDDAENVFVKLSAIERAKRNPRVLEDRAELAASRGRFSELIALTDQLISVLEGAETPDLMALALARKDRASRSWADGDLVSADNFYRLANDAYERSRDPRPVVKANIQNEIGYYHFLKGDYKRSSDTFAPALNYFERRDSSNYGKPHTFNNFAVLYIKIAKYAEADKYIRRSIAVQETVIGKRTRLHSTALFNLANLLLQTGQYEGAAHSFEEAATILERWRDAVAEKGDVEFGLAQVLFFTGKRDEAQARLLRAAENVRAAAKPGSAAPTISLVQLSRLFRINGQFTNALAALSAVNPAASERAPASWREYLVERGTLLWWTPNQDALAAATDAVFLIAFASSQPDLVSPVEQTRFLLFKTVLELSKLNFDQAINNFCRASGLVVGEVARNLQLIEEVNLVRAKFASAPRCL